MPLSAEQEITRWVTYGAQRAATGAATYTFGDTFHDLLVNRPAHLATYWPTGTATSQVTRLVRARTKIALLTEVPAHE